MTLPKIQDANVKNKKVLLRMDLDVLMEKGHVQDAFRLQTGIKTLSYLQHHGATIIIAGHAGRPDGKVDENLSLHPVALWFAHQFGGHVESQEIGEFSGWKITENVFLLENLRFDKGEEADDPGFVDRLSSIADIYCNDAFAVSHRDNASITGICKKLPHFAGLHLQKEIEELSGVIEDVKQPLVVIIGGAKIETKLPIVERMENIADYILVGGKIATQTEILEKAEQKTKKATILVADMQENGNDITQNSLDNFLQIIPLAKTIIWNGTMGLIRPKSERKGSDNPEYATAMIAKAIVATSAHTILGGGDTAEFVKELGLTDKFSFVSSGGGAMLAFLSGEKLPGIEALKE